MYRGLRGFWERLLAHRDAPIPSLPRLRADVPPNVDLVFQRLVAKQPERRYQTMTAVREALEQCLNPRVGDAAAGAGEFFHEVTPCRVAPAVGRRRVAYGLRRRLSRRSLRSTIAMGVVAAARHCRSRIPTTRMSTNRRWPHGCRWRCSPHQSSCWGWWSPAHRDSAEPDVANKQKSASVEQPETETAEPVQPPVTMLANVDPVPNLTAVPEPRRLQPAESPSTAVPVPIKRSLAQAIPRRHGESKTIGSRAAVSANRAISEVRTAFRSDFDKAQSPWRKAELAKELMLRIKEVRNTPEKNYALLHSARRLAIEGELPTSPARLSTNWRRGSRSTFSSRSRTQSRRPLANCQR